MFNRLDKHINLILIEKAEKPYLAAYAKDTKYSNKFSVREHLKWRLKSDK